MLWECQKNGNPWQCADWTKWRLFTLVLCDTHDTSILIVDTYVTIPVSPRSRYTAVYRSSTKYRETVQVSRVSTIPCSSYHLATCMLQSCDAETNSKVAENHNYHNTTMSALCASSKQVESYFIFFCISAALLSHDCTAQRHRRKQATVYVVTACHSTDAHTHDFNDCYSLWVDWVLTETGEVWTT